MTQSPVWAPGRASGAFILTLGFFVLLASAIWLYWTVDGAVAYQREVRLASRARGTVFRDVLDAETSLRGFTSTENIDFLVPFGNTQSVIDGHLAELTDRLNGLGTPQLVHLVDDETRVFRRWHDTVAAPLLANDRRADARELQTRGKILIDRFRQDDRLLGAGIDAAAGNADRAVNVALGRIVIVTGVLALSFGLVYAYFSRQRRSMIAQATRAQLMYENEKRIAGALQSAFEQKALPVVANMAFHASYVPASTDARVGGDWYDAFELPDGRVLFSIGDVAGHGIDAAVSMSRARQAIISNASHERDPAVVLRSANDSLMLQEPKMVTAVCGYIDPDGLRITYATAGHPPPILALPGQEPDFLDYDGLPLGIFAGVEYRTFTVVARPSALLVLYTDGVTEVDRDLLGGEQRLLAATRVARESGANDPAASVRDAIFADRSPSDDVAIMTVTFAAADAAANRTLDPAPAGRVRSPGGDIVESERV